MNNAEDMDRLLEKLLRAERMNRIYLKELADYAVSMETANKLILELRLELLRWKGGK